MNIKIALAQVPVTMDVSRNLEKTLEAVSFAADQKADILVTPEGFLSGYSPEIDQEEVAKALGKVTSFAQEKAVGLAIGVCFKEGDKVYNQQRHYSPSGEYLGCHCKILNCCESSDRELGEYREFSTIPLATFDFKGIRCGGLICNDMWANPECTPMDDSHLAQKLSEMGAKIIFHSVNGGRDDSHWSQVVTRNYHEMNLRMRARGGKVWIATVDNAADCDIPTAAPGGVIDPNGNWVARTADVGESYCCFDIEI